MKTRHGRREPYTAIGVSRLPCFRCGGKSEFQWSICADGNMHRPVCRLCDCLLNAIVLTWAGFPDAEQKLDAYLTEKLVSPEELYRHAASSRETVGAENLERLHMLLMPGEQPRPSLEQVAWVLGKVSDHLTEGGSFRFLIYDRMGFGQEAYGPLHDAGGMAISNAFAELEDLKEARKCARCGTQPAYQDFEWCQSCRPGLETEHKPATREDGSVIDCKHPADRQTPAWHAPQPATVCMDCGAYLVTPVEVTGCGCSSKGPCFQCR